MIGLGGEIDVPTCSRAGCGEGAAWRLDWRNPRIHTAERVKTWLACDEHVEYLRDFLAARDFPLTVAPLGSADTTADTAAGSGAEGSPAT